MDRSRRELLATAGATAAAIGTTSLAGCLDFAAGAGPQGPEGTPETLSCADDGFVRLDQPFEEPVAERTTETPETTFELSIEGVSETYGQEIRLVLSNAGSEPASTLGKYAYSLQRETASGWADVRGSTTGEAASLPQARETLDPTGGYTWALTLDEASIADAVPDRELDVCPPLGPGTHRFVYWGVTDGSPVGVEFELVG